MKTTLFFIVILCFQFTQIPVSAQEKSPIKFGKISVEDIKTSVYRIDSNAAAVIIADVGNSYYEGNERGWFSFFHERHRRVHILKKSGYDAADIEIPLYTDGSVQEEVQSLKAVTYNLENGTVKEIKLDNKNIFTDKIDRNHIVKKFTFPDVKEGSIVEYSYTIRSDYWNLPTNWYFQDKYPVLWSELEFNIPEFFYFIIITEGYNSFYKKQPPETFTSTFYVNIESLEAGSRVQRERKKIEAQVFRHRWVIKDAPGIRPERFTSSILNHISKIEFQLSEIRQPLNPELVMQTWEMLTQKLLMSEYFGLQLNSGNGGIDDELKDLIKGVGSQFEKCKRIYEYVRDNFTCVDYSARYMEQTLRNVVKSKKGNVAEINLLLVSMLKNSGLRAEPVLLATRSHGYTYSRYPIEDKFNYVIAMAEIDGQRIYLDATRPRLKCGVLPSECFNGFAIIVNKEATPLTFNPDSLLEKKVTTVLITNQGGGVMSGKYQQVPGVYESYNIRNEVTQKGMEAFFINFKKSFSNAETKLNNVSIDSLKRIDEPISIGFEFEFPTSNDDIIYFNPVIAGDYKENPFKSATRNYPVEMPYTIDEAYVFRMEVPDGYRVDEIPISTKVNFDEEGASFFEYIVTNNNNIVSLRTRVKLMRTFFMPEEYEILRKFFSLIVSKQSEQIVFKKKK